MLDRRRLVVRMTFVRLYLSHFFFELVVLVFDPVPGLQFVLNHIVLLERSHEIHSESFN